MDLVSSSRRNVQCLQLCLERAVCHCAQVTLNKFMLPKLADAIQGQRSSLRLASLSHNQFPNWCGGPCGCQGGSPRGPSRFIRLNNEFGHLITGRIECPREVVDGWLMYHVPCAGSPLEKLSILDAYQHMSDSLQARPVATSHRRQDLELSTSGLRALCRASK